MVLVERDTELRQLENALAESGTRRGQVILVDGPPSCGRTDLFGTFAANLADDDVLLLTATGSRADHALPFGMVSQLVAGAPLSDEQRDRMNGLLDAGTREADAAEANPVTVFHKIWLTLLELSAHTTVVLGVDDLQHADPASLECLLYLIRRISSMRCLIVLTSDGDTSRHRHLEFHAELLRQPTVHRLRLAPLSLDGVTELVTRRVDSTAAAWLAPRLLELSGGNPLLLNALIDDHIGTGVMPGQAYRLAMLSSLYRADPTLPKVARALAILGSARAPLSELAELSPDTVAAALRTMTSAGLLADNAFRHPEARAVALDGSSRQENAELNLRAARLLHEHGAEAPSVARHLVEARLAPALWAVTVLIEAADQAVLSGGVEFAAECLRLAHQACADDQQRVEILVRLVHAEWQTNPATAARHLPAMVAAARAGKLDRSARLVLIRRMLWFGRVQEAATQLEALRGTGADPELRDVEQWLAATHPALTSGAVHAFRRPDPRVTPSGDPWLRSAAALAEALMNGARDSAVDLATDVLRDTHLDGGTVWAQESAALALVVLICADHTGVALEWCERLEHRARHQACAPARAIHLAAAAEIALRHGDLSAAAAKAEAALAELPAKAWGVTVGLPLGTLMLANTRMGRFDETAKALTMVVPDAMLQSRWGLHYLHARGHHYLATNHSHAALADFLSCGELMRAWGLDVANLVPWRLSAAEAWLRLGNRDQARRLVYDQLGRPDTDGTRIRGLALRLLATASSAGRRAQLLTEALEVLESAGDRFEQARVLSELSRAHSDLNENRRARLMFRRALHVANSCAAAPLAEELLALSGEPTGPASISGGRTNIPSLTNSERRVAALAVMGYTNREIAARLFITASTVEQHLTRVYRKLNVKRRRDLPVDLWSEATKTG